MIETEANLPQKKMKMFSGYSTERIPPVFSIAPEAFDPVDVISTFRSASLLPDHHVVSLDAQRTVCLPVISVVETAGLGVSSDQPDHSLPFSCGNREHLHLAVALQDPQYDDFAGGPPTSFAVPSPANCGLVALDGSFEGVPQFLGMSTTSSHQAIEALDRRSTGQSPKTLPVHRHAQNEEFQQTTLGAIRQAACCPRGRLRLAVSAGSTLQASVGEFVSTSVIASTTSSHSQTSVNLVRFG
jgi:hypothetical protein